MRVLLTNDDGIEADGLQALRRALLEVPDIELAVIAPDGNRSAMARSITTRRPLWVQEVDFGDGTVGYATDGTPVDCVRFARLGLIDGFEADLIVSGINHGANLGDDITYSGTVAAALEGVVLGIPGIAVSQQSGARELDFRLGRSFDFEVAAQFTARIVDELDEVPLADGTLLNPHQVDALSGTLTALLAEAQRNGTPTTNGSAPAAAPADNPITSGLPSGLRVTAWNSAPETPNAAPAAMAVTSLTPVTSVGTP